MKILHISFAKSWNGGEQQTIDLIDQLNEMNQQNILLCLKNSSIEKYAKENKIEHEGIEKKGIGNIFYLKSIKRKIDRISPDILHIHTSNFLSYFVLADILFSINYPVIFSVKAIIRGKNILSKLKYNYKGIDKIYCVSQAVRSNFSDKVLVGKNKEKAIVILDGINIKRLSINNEIDFRTKFGLPENSFIVGNVANHTKSKDLITFLKAANFIINNKKIPNIYFIQIGGFSKRSKDYLAYMKNNVLEEKVFFTNFIKNASGCIPQFDIKLMSSSREGLSLSILEAFYFKVPVVSTNAGGIPEAITDKKNGLLSNVGDYKSLAENVLKIYDDDVLGKSLSETADKILRSQFDSTLMGDNTFKVYKKMLKKNRE